MTNTVKAATAMHRNPYLLLMMTLSLLAAIGQLYVQVIGAANTRNANERTLLEAAQHDP